MNAAQIAKATLQRLAQSKLEPTPENYARAWSEAGGPAGAGGHQWATLIDQMLRGLERSSKQWTTARKKASLERVLDGSRSDAQRLRERLTQLVASWDDKDAGADAAPEALAEASSIVAVNPPAAQLARTVQAALPSEADAALAASFGMQAQRFESGATDESLALEVERACADAKRVFTQRMHLHDELARLVRELTEGLTELAEDESWARGQAEAMRAQLGDAGQAPSVRGVRAAGDLLVQTRRRQLELKAERDRARDAIKALVASLVNELSGLAGTTGRFGDEMLDVTERLQRGGASQAELAQLVHEIVGKSRAVQADVSSASERLAAGRAEAERLTERVRELEGELKRLSDEVSTDALTQVANRRGLAQAFEVEAARATRDDAALAVGLIDLDNFKKLNDSLGHAAGDQALKALASQVRAALRPGDHLARFGGEEFVVLLPGTALDEAREVLTRLQRGLSASLFMHEGREVFVTFSAGVTAWCPGEPLDAAIERADSALYEAKRTGKNRTCTA